MKKIVGKLTYANVMATIAVFIALGGASYAAIKLPKNSVGAKQLKKNAVTPTKLSKASRQALQGPAGPSGAGPAYGVFHQDAVELTGSTPRTIVTLTGLPAGSYAIVAKAEVFAGSTKSISVSCDLGAGGASGSGEPSDGSLSIVGNGTLGSAAASNISYQLLHTFGADGGTVTLSCTEESQSSDKAEVVASRIYAMRVVSQTSIAG